MKALIVLDCQKGMLAVSWIGLGKSRSYTSMSSKREGNSRFVIQEESIKEQ